MKRQSRCPVLLIAAMLLSPGAAADGYPAKPVKIITQGAAGSGPDVITRIVADHLGRSWGQQVAILNHPGAGGVMAGRAAASAERDGYTLYAPTITTFVILPEIQPTLPFDLERDFARVGLLARDSDDDRCLSRARRALASGTHCACEKDAWRIVLRSQQSRLAAASDGRDVAPTCRHRPDIRPISRRGGRAARPHGRSNLHYRRECRCAFRTGAVRLHHSACRGFGSAASKPSRPADHCRNAARLSGHGLVRAGRAQRHTPKPSSIRSTVTSMRFLISRHCGRDFRIWVLSCARCRRPRRPRSFKASKRHGGRSSGSLA